MKLNAGTDSLDWEPAAQALRDELAEYGGLFQLLEEQKAALLSRDLEKLTSLSKTIEEQLELADGLRERRERLLDAIAGAYGADTNTLASLAQCFPVAVRPMFESLLKEAGEILHRVQAATRRNRALLARASEIQEQILRRLKPRGVTKTYTAHGRVRLRSLHSGGMDLSA